MEKARYQRNVSWRKKERSKTGDHLGAPKRSRSIGLISCFWYLHPKLSEYSQHQFARDHTGHSIVIPKISIIVKFLGSGACVRARMLSLQSCSTLCNPMDCSHQTLLSMGFSRQEYWSGLPCPPPGDLPKPGIKSKSLTSPVLAGGFSTTTGSGDWVQIPTYWVISGESGTIPGVGFLIC